MSQLLLAGTTNKDPELLGLARDLVPACNKAAIDGYDTPEQNSLEQIGFSLRELGLALPELRKPGLLTGGDALPAYGEADWNGAPALWIAIFEWAGSVFREPKYRAAADAIFRYQIARGLPVGDLSEAVNDADESISSKSAPRRTVLLERLSGRGERVPDKVILRGTATNDETGQPYVMMQCTESYGHSHPHAGSISAYGTGGSVLLNTLGYDATATPLHQSFMVRPPDEPFLQFFGDPGGTRIGKIMPDGQRLTARIISDEREVRSADAQDVGDVALGRIVCDYLTSWHPEKRFNGHAFQQTRSLALDGTTGVLCVLDTIESKSEVRAAFGPIWHVQRVLAKNEMGFLCQSDMRARVDGKAIGSNPRSIWGAMAGAEGTRLNDVFWKFTAHNSHTPGPPPDLSNDSRHDSNAP